MTNETCTYRAPLDSDAPAISKLIGSTWAHFFAYSVTPSDLAGYLAGPLSPSSIAHDIRTPSEIFLVAVSRANEIVGVAQLAKGMSEDCLAHAPAIHLRRLYVNRACHGQGVAGELMARIEARARDEECQSIWLGVWEDNHMGRRFYEKMGYVERGEKRFMVGESKRRDLVLEKKL